MTGVFVPVGRCKEPTVGVFRRLGGLSHFTESRHPNRLRPLVEITAEADLATLHTFRSAGEQPFVELPVYHSTTEEPNDLMYRVEKLLERYGGQTGFYRHHRDEIDIPVLSGSIQRPLDYATIAQHYETIAGEFETIAARLFVSAESLTDSQRTVLADLSASMDPEAFVLLDSIETGLDSGLEATLRALTDIFSRQRTVVLNAFNAREGYPTNHGPDLARRLELTGFGDFALGRRFEHTVEYSGPTKIRYYDPDRSAVVEYQGANYLEAAAKLDQDGYLDSDHCRFCKEAKRTDTNYTTAWSRTQRGHYVVAALEEPL